MSKISTLFTCLALAVPAALSAQGPKPVSKTAQLNAVVSYDAIRQQMKFVENPNMVSAKPIQQHHQTLAPNGKTTLLSTIPLGTASNGLSSTRPYQNQVVNVDSLGIVAFIHRQDISIWGGGTTENGRYRYDLSIDGGATFTNDLGTLQSVYTNYGRFPQMVAFNPGTSTNPFDSKFAWYGPTNRFPTPGWLDHTNGLSDITQGTPISTEHYNFDSRNPQLPGGLTQGLPGEFWAVSFQDDANSEITDSLFVHKGVYDSGTMDINWTIDQIILPPYDMSGDGSRIGIGPNIAFSPDGMHGWIAMISNIGTDDKDSTVFPVLWHSTDGGATWGAPTEVDLDQFPWVYDSLRTGYFMIDSTTLQPLSSGLATCGFEFDITVDEYGDVHFVSVVGSTSTDAVYSISSGLAKFIVDLHSTGGGAGWDMTYLSPILAFRGTFGTGSGTQLLTQDNYPQISRNNKGSMIFYSWVDSDTAEFTGNQAGIGEGNSDNLAPNLRIAARRVFDGAMPYPKIISDGDLSWDGKILAPTMAPVVHKIGSKYELPIVFMEQLQNDNTLPCAFHYVGHDAFFDFSVDQFCDGDQMDLTWTSWGYTGASPVCAVGTENQVGSSIILNQSFPNPANTEAVIRFVLPSATNVEMDLVNVYGQQVATLANGQFNTGIHDIRVETSKLAAGVYFYNLRADGEVITKKMIVSK